MELNNALPINSLRSTCATCYVFVPVLAVPLSLLFIIDRLATPSMTTEQQDNIAVRDDRNQTRNCTSSALLTNAPQSSVGWQPEKSSRLQNYQISQKDNL